MSQNAESDISFASESLSSAFSCSTSSSVRKRTRLDAEASPSETRSVSQRNTAARRHCFTVNVDSFDFLPDIRDKCLAGIHSGDFGYICFQCETAPTTGQRHYQGYVHWGKPTRFNAVVARLQSIFQQHPFVSECNGTTSQNRAYCSDSSKGCDFSEFGNIPPDERQRVDLRTVARSIDQGNDLSLVARENASTFIKYHAGIRAYQALTRSTPRISAVAPTVYWWFGPTGVGKSRKAFDHFGAVAYVKMNNQWWDGYCGQTTVIMDDYRTNLCPFSELLRILDRYPHRVQMKGSSCELSATCFVITTSSRPEVLWHGRTEEALNQLLRRITNIEEFKEDGSSVILKDSSIDYVMLPLHERGETPTPCVSTFYPNR